MKCGLGPTDPKQWQSPQAVKSIKKLNAEKDFCFPEIKEDLVIRS